MNTRKFYAELAPSVWELSNEVRNVSPQQSERSTWWRSLAGAAAFGFGAVVAFYLITEHRAHLYGALPFLLFLACPIMMIFMHHGHGGHDHQDRAPGDPEPPRPSRESRP